MSDAEESNIEEADLFGDEEEARPVRELSDKELDSGDDEGRDDRAIEEEPMDVDDEGAVRNAQILEIELGRQTLPITPDGQIHSFRLPGFLGLDPMPYDVATFQKPTTDHHSDTQSKDFSAADIAATTIRYQKNQETGLLESNTIISRWSDGTATIHIGDNDYELLAKPLCQTDLTKPYEPKQDSHQYLCTPHAESSVLQVIGHITNQYTVIANSKVADFAIQRLEARLKATGKGRLNLNGDRDTGMQVITQTQDPELQKKEAEAAEKEKNKMQRRREAAAAKAEYSTGRGRMGGGGLSLEDLEGRSGRLPTLKKKRALPGSGPKRSRKRADYSSDEEDDRPGRHREDEYDLEDGFLAGSDEEIEEDEGSEEDIDDGIVESPREKSGKPKAKKQKRDESDEEDEDADVDAEGEPDDEAPVNDASGRRKRNVIEDDEDDE